jgi:hypothetical protein
LKKQLLVLAPVVAIGKYVPGNKIGVFESLNSVIDFS